MEEKKTGDNLKVQEENLEIAGVGFWDIFCDDGSIPDLILTYQSFLKVCNQVSRVDLILERPLKRAEYKRLDCLFPRATSRADVLAHPFGDCREGRIPRSSAALQV